MRTKVIENADRKVMISASRRTDMLACQPDRLAAALTGQLRSTRSLTPDRVHTLLISTKDYRNYLDHEPLKAVCRQCDQVCFNFTLTGFGGTELEPRVPSPELLLDRLPELVEAVGDGRRVSWCYDPILSWHGLSNVSATVFDEYARCFCNAGIQRVFCMFFYPYANSRITPDCLEDEQRREFAQAAKEICQRLGLELSFCHLPKLHMLKCVDLDWLCRLHPENDRTPIEHYRQIKREDATYCRDAIWDIGWYVPPCPHGCLYCYGSPASEKRAGRCVD